MFVDDESYSLIVNDLSLMDAGEYSVCATNKLGKVESACKLKSGQFFAILPVSQIHAINMIGVFGWKNREV